MKRSRAELEEEFIELSDAEREHLHANWDIAHKSGSIPYGCSIREYYVKYFRGAQDE